MNILTTRPLKPPAGILLWIQPLRRQTASDCEAFTPKQFRRASCRSAQSFVRVNQLRGNSSRQSVMYFPPKTPSRSISFGVNSGVNPGAKFRPAGSVRQ